MFTVITFLVVDIDVSPTILGFTGIFELLVFDIGVTPTTSDLSILFPTMVEIVGVVVLFPLLAALNDRVDIGY